MRDKGIKKTDFKGLKLFSTGKVRDIYDLDRYLLIVATDRISAFDVIMPDPIPGKGEILTRMSTFWFERTRDIITNHFVTMDPEAYPPQCAPYREQLQGRSMLVRKAEPLPVECVVRGYLSGSGWTDYRREGAVSGIRLPEGLRESERLAEPLFTPTTKAPAGEHDLAITRKEMESIIGTDLTAKIIEASLKIYERASAIAELAGIIIADTKMEFGLAGGELSLIDELLTPDSSRFWPKAGYRAGETPHSYDKQFLRDYLTSIHWDKKPPAPSIPPEIVEKTREKYLEALRCLVR